MTCHSADQVTLILDNIFNVASFATFVKNVYRPLLPTEVDAQTRKKGHQFKDRN